MRLTFGLDHNAKVGMGLEIVENEMQVVTIEAHGLVHQHISRESFLRRFHRDLLQEEWSSVCRLLAIALSKDSNEVLAIDTLTRSINMKLDELKDKKMAELVEMHNTLAKAVGGKEVTKFKTLEAGRIEVVKLANAKKPATAADKAAPKVGGGVEGRKRNGVGARAKVLLLEGKTTGEVFDIIRKEFPDNSTTKPCIAYYKNALVKEGKLPGGRAAKAEAPPAVVAPVKPVKGSKSKKVAAEATA